MKWGLVAALVWVVASLLLRPAAPIDETRYLAVAWEMHLADGWLVPTLDGQPYSHKPPLLFWLIRAGWLLFGVQEWWPRLIPAIAAALCLLLTCAVARAAGIERPKHASAVLLACLAVPVYASVLLFDLLLTAWVLLAWWALLQTRRSLIRTTAVTALACALGILTKGPVVLIYVVPTALFVPRAWRALLIALPIAAAAALAWAIPAAQAGGEAYADAILWSQTAGRVHDSFSHARPFWWYIPVLMLLGLPWSVIPATWQRLTEPDARLKPLRRATLLSFVLLMLLSGKQPHYLLPLLPILAIIIAARGTSTPERTQSLRRISHRSAWVIPAALVIGLLAIRPHWGAAFDVRPIAQRVAQAQAAGQSVYWAGDSHGQLTFHGRLERPVSPVSPHRLDAWLRARPQVWVALPSGAAERVGLWQPKRWSHAAHVQPFRGEKIALLPAWQLLPPLPDFSAAIDSSRTVIDTALQARMAGPGISVCVGVRGQVAWSEGFGHADLATQQPVTNDTLFRIGSVSKPLTAVALMRLVDQGKLQLDDEVRRWLPDFSSKQWPITLRQLGGHLGGVRHYRGAEFLSARPYASVTAGLELFADDALIHEPGTRYRYSSYGFNLLSAAMESAADMDFLELMQQEVFDPLGMPRTQADFATQPTPQRTQFYSKLAGLWVPAPPVDLSNKWAGGGFLSCPEDLVNFGFHMLGSGHLSRDSRNQMLTSQQTATGDKTGYGIGWSIALAPRPSPVWSHSGGSVGGSTAFIVDPKNELVIAVVVNCGDAPAVRLARQIAAEFTKTIVQAKLEQQW